MKCAFARGRGIGSPFSPDLLNCSILHVDGITDLPPMMKVLRALGKPMLVVHDTDSHLEDEKDKAIAAGRVKDIQDAKAPDTVLFSCDPFFEQAAGMPDPKKRGKGA